MTDLPSSVVVGPFEYAVLHTELDVLRSCHQMQRSLYGASSHKQLTITIDPDQARGQKCDTLLHETLHAISSMTGLDVDWGDHEEVYIRRLAPALVDVIRRNPELVAFLVGEVQAEGDPAGTE